MRLNRLAALAGCLGGSLALRCLPQTNLDAAARGAPKADAGAGSTKGPGGGAAGDHLGPAGRDGSSTGGAGTFAGGATFAGEGGAAASQSGSSAGGVSGSASFGALPAELNDPPVKGNVTWSADATWPVNGVDEPAFQIVTPSATYFLVKKLGMIVSIVDGYGGGGHEWIGYSDAFRPKRGLPNFGACCEADATSTLTTTYDPDSVTVGHVRLNSQSASQDWSLVWDFYRTHATLTVNLALQPFSFSYRGVPGGALDAADRFVVSNGKSYSALDSLVDAAFDGSVQWAYLADDGRQRSLFLMQYGSDSQLDQYGVSDSDTAVLSFGSTHLQAPIRFSFGLLDSTSQADVQARVNYVASVTSAD